MRTVCFFFFWVVLAEQSERVHQNCCYLLFFSLMYSSRQEAWMESCLSSLCDSRGTEQHRTMRPMLKRLSDCLAPFCCYSVQRCHGFITLVRISGIFQIPSTLELLFCLLHWLTCTCTTRTDTQTHRHTHTHTQIVCTHTHTHMRAHAHAHTRTQSILWHQGLFCFTRRCM